MDQWHDRQMGQETAADYRKRINAVMHHVQAHLDRSWSLEELAAMAGFSPYHFHRIFRAMAGETLGSYVRRLRLERAARQLRSSSQSITEIALTAGYATPAAFSKAFKQHFAVTPSTIRQEHLIVSPVRHRAPVMTLRRRCAMQPQIRELPAQTIYYVRRIGLVNGDFTQAARDGFGVLMAYLEDNGLEEQWATCLGITPDDPESVAPEHLRYDAGFIFRPGIEPKPEGEVAIQVLDAGRWAVFLHQGPYDTLWQTWNAVFRDWLPGSGMILRDVPPYEVYLDDPNYTEPANLRTEIHIPIE